MYEDKKTAYLNICVFYLLILTFDGTDTLQNIRTFL